MTPDEILDIEMADDNLANATTVREFLGRVLEQVWIDKFDLGKRVFGYSGWRSEVYEELVRVGAVVGDLDEDGYVETIDTDEADELILAAIRRM